MTRYFNRSLQFGLCSHIVYNNFWMFCCRHCLTWYKCTCVSEGIGMLRAMTGYIVCYNASFAVYSDNYDQGMYLQPV